MSEEENDDNGDDGDDIVAESSHSAQKRKPSKKKIPKKKPEIKLTNITIVYLPPNTTAHLQSMDAGIIHSFKAKYKREFCKHIIDQFDKGIDREKYVIF